MRAAIYGGPRDVQVVDLPIPEVGDDDVLIENLHAGVCGTDVHAFQHGPGAHRMTVGDEFGHEMVSRVVQVGANVTGIEVGQRVYPYPLLARGDSSRAATLGGFSQYICVPHPQLGRELYAVPDEITDKTAALIEPFTVAMHAVRRSEPKPGEKAIVFGAGTIGIGAAVGLAELGCEDVMVVDHSSFRLEKAAALGFATCNSRDQDLKEVSIAHFGEARGLRGPTTDADIFIEATGANGVLATYQEISKIFSRMVVVGVHAQPISVDFATLAFSHQAFIGAGGYTPDDVHAVITAMRSGKHDLDSIVTHEFPLEKIVEALTTAADVDTALNVSIVHSSSGS